jgi:hypothetical protein
LSIDNNQSSFMSIEYNILFLSVANLMMWGADTFLASEYVLSNDAPALFYGKRVWVNSYCLLLSTFICWLAFGLEQVETFENRQNHDSCLDTITIVTSYPYTDSMLLMYSHCQENNSVHYGEENVNRMYNYIVRILAIYLQTVLIYQLKNYEKIDNQSSFMSIEYNILFLVISERSY